MHVHTHTQMRQRPHYGIVSSSNPLQQKKIHLLHVQAQVLLTQIKAHTGKVASPPPSPTTNDSDTASHEKHCWCKIHLHIYGHSGITAEPSLNEKWGHLLYHDTILNIYVHVHVSYREKSVQSYIYIYIYINIPEKSTPPSVHHINACKVPATCTM